MMAERDGLRGLQVRKARHHHVGARERALGERPLQVGDLAVERVDGVAHPELEIGRDLVVARARGVQAPGRRADQRAEPAFDVHVHVLEGARKFEFAGLDFAFDFVQTLRDGGRVLGADDALRGEHRDMGLGSGYILGAELAVKVDRGVDLFHDLGRGAREPAAPHLVAHFGTLA